MTRKRRTYTDEFKREAVQLVTDQGYSLSEASRNLGVHANVLLHVSGLPAIPPPTT